MSNTQRPNDSILINITEDVLRATDVLTQKGPVKQVRGDSDLFRWVRSQAYRDLIAYINNTSLALQGRRLTESFPVSEEMQRLCDMFDDLERPLAKHTDTSASSKVSVSYLAWLRHMFQIVLRQLAGAVSGEKCMHIHELGEYLRRSFGNATTLEFGPGNELMFLFFLCGLFRADILRARDTVAAALMLFYRYIHLVRRLIAIYNLPISRNPRCAIEDYFFVPYLWGAAQLCLDAPFSPPQCDQPKAIESYRHDYMMVNLIENLPEKSGPLSHNAFQLWCILSAPTWPEVYRGLERCYINHILSSFHTVENAIFWELMSFDMAPAEGLLHRPSMGQRERRVSGVIQQEEGPVRPYSSLGLFTSLHELQKTSEEETDDDDMGDRLVMLHPTTEVAAGLEDLETGERLSDTSTSNTSAETRFFMGKDD